MTISMELAETNSDWAATSAIYAEESKTRPLQLEQGFIGTVTLSISVSTTAFCRKIAQQQEQYRYFVLDTPPILKIELEYNYDREMESDDEALPRNLKLEWVCYPGDWPIDHKESHLSWLNKKCTERLQQENELMTMCASFSVVEFCEHGTLAYWETIHHDSDYRLILLPPKMDHMYHSNPGSTIEPKKEAAALGTENNLANPSSSLQYARQALIKCWSRLFFAACPICFDTKRCDEGITLPCGDFFCQDCFSMYLKVKAGELDGYRTNPFLCPVENCRVELSIETIVKSHLSKADFGKIELWIKDLKFPQCYALDQCLSKACSTANSKQDNDFCMRKCSNDTKNIFIFCEVCDKRWCELCLKRIQNGISRQEHREVCESQIVLKFCRRYMRATDEQKLACQNKFPWIQTYARFRQNDGGAIEWILENGQCCPNCSTGVERIEGCFHMKCPVCATHFCYECGKEIFPPFYGTHHCWEEQDFIEEFE